MSCLSHGISSGAYECASSKERDGPENRKEEEGGSAGAFREVSREVSRAIFTSVSHRWTIWGKRTGYTGHSTAEGPEGSFLISYVFEEREASAGMPHCY
jgi:hypothetical protein